MARRSREEGEGAVHHAWAHAIRAEPLFRDASDRELYLRVLGEVVLHCGVRLLGYCQMTTHVHLLIETPGANLGVAMRRLHGEYAVRFNQRHGLRGHLFEKRYGSNRQHTTAQLQVTAAYVANNPVVARMVDRAEDWPWSSHAAVLREQAPRWLDQRRLLDFFSGSGGVPLDRYRRFVAGELFGVPAASR